jgi:hypothetical protein
MCTIKEGQLDRARRDLLLAEGLTRDTQRQLVECRTASHATTAQLAMQRTSRLKAEAEAEDARCSLRVLQIESDGLQQKCDASAAK